MFQFSCSQLLARLADESLEHAFQIRDVAREAELLREQLAAMLAHLPRERLVAQQALDAQREARAVHPRHEKSVVAVNEPFLDAAGVEGHDRQAVTHRFEADRAERLGPDRTQDGHARVAVMIFQFFLRHEAFEVNAVLQSEFVAKLFAMRAVIALAKNKTL